MISELNALIEKRSVARIIGHTLLYRSIKTWDYLYAGQYISGQDGTSLLFLYHDADDVYDQIFIQFGSIYFIECIKY